MKPITFAEWQRLTRRVREAADRMREERERQVYAMARAVGLPDNPTLIHNASCDSGLRGWCAGPGGVERLRVAKRCAWMLKGWIWEPSRRADAIVTKSWRRVAR